MKRRTQDVVTDGDGGFAKTVRHLGGGAPEMVRGVAVRGPAQSMTDGCAGRFEGWFG